MTRSRMILPCLRGVIGDWVYYSSLMTAQQVSEWILQAKNIREAASLDEELQRDLKERKKSIAKYLLTQESRFFNSIIIGVFKGTPDWYEFELGNHPNLSLEDNELEYLKDSIGFLSFDGTEKMFAIDGQHRVAGIEIAYNQDKKLKESEQILLEDQYSVLFVAHIDDAPGMRRTRKLFSDININAKPVAQGDRIKIDEENLNAIVTRKLYANYQYFQKGNLISLTENAKLDLNDKEHFTNLLGLFNTCKALRPIFKKGRGTQEWEESNVEEFYSITQKFFDTAINEIQELKAFFIDKKLTIEESRKNNAHLLYRPIGLKLLARIYTHYKSINREGDFSKEVNKINFVFPKSHFNKILWNDGRMEAKAENQNIAFKLSMYLLNKTSEQEEEALLENYRTVLKNDKAMLPEKIIGE